MTDAVEKESGAITAFFNGPEGDVVIVPAYTRTEERRVGVEGQD